MATLTIVNQHGQTLASHRLGNAPLAIRAQDQVQYQLAGEGGLAPANVQAARAGNDLLVNIDGQTALRIEDYFLLDDTGLKNPLLGLNESGQYVAYGIVEAPSALPVEHVLAEEVAGVSTASSGISPLAALATIGGVALTGAVIAGSRKNDDKTDNGTPQQPQTPFDPNQPTPPSVDNGNTNPPPSDGGNTTPPPSGGGNTTPPPSGGGNTNPPPSGGNTMPPPSGGNTTPPPSGGGDTNPPPSGGGNTNPPPQQPKPNGSIAIEGEAKVGQTLTAKISDAEGISGSPKYQWLADGQPIANATQSTYTLTAAEKGKTISVQATYTDTKNTAENPTSAASAQVVEDTPAPQPPADTTAPTLTISAMPSTLTPGGSTQLTFKASEPVKGFTADDVIVQGGTLSAFRQVDATTFTATFTAGATGKAGVTVADDAFADLADNPNEFARLELTIGAAPNPPAPPSAANETARLSISGLAQVGKTLAAKVTDGNGFTEADVQYQWFADGKAISGATAASYRVAAADTGKNLSVQALYTDHAGHKEAPVSSLSTSVIHPPQGASHLPKPASDYVVSVKDGAFAAKGDGQTDDTAAIQKAIDAVAEKGGGVVEVPGGTYMIDGLTSVNMRSHVTLKLADDAVFKAVPNDSESYILVQFIEVENAHLTGGTLIGDRDEHGTMRGEWGHGVGIYSSKNIVVENVVARDFWGDGFSIGRAWGKEQGENITLNHITGDNNRRQVVFVSDGKNIKILNSLISNTSGTAPHAGIDLEPDPNREINGVEVRGNTFENNHGWGFLVSMVKQPNAAVKNVVVEDNLFKNNERAIALWGLTGGRVAGNTIHHDGDERMPVGITISEHTTGVTVEGNTIYGGGINTRLNSADHNTIGKNDFKAGVFIIGDPTAGETLTARVIDADNPKTENVIPEKNVQYQWHANGEKIDGATAASYTPTAADHSKTIHVQVAFTDASGNTETAESRATLPVDGAPPNRAPGGIRLNDQEYPTDITVPEGKPGAIIGKITTLDPDAGDTHTYFVRDLRFEIKNGILKLKDGVKIDYEHEKEIFLAIYSYDQDKRSDMHEFTLRVADDPNHHGKKNQKPTDILLSHDKVMENSPGATVGKLSAVDPDGDGFHTYYLSDRRFYVDEQGYLKVRNGVILEHGGRSIPITTTVTDSGGNSLQKTFYIKVEDNPDWPENRLGSVKVEGQAKVGQTLAASVADPDGAPDTIQYQWYADGSKIEGAQSAEYTVQSADLGKQLTAQARYTDDAGHSETAESPRTFPVAAENAKPLTVRLEPELNLDKLERGSDGQDRFTLDSHGVKTIVDFNISDGDLLQLESDAFTALDKGTLAERAFIIGDKAGHAEHRILYNAQSGQLAYDPGGNGAAAATVIARLNPGLELEAQHIQII